MSNTIDACHEAVHQYMREHYGESPKYLLMNHKVYYDMGDALRRFSGYPPDDFLTFRGVRIIPSDKVKVSEGIIACG